MTMTTYPKPNTSDDYRATARECADRAQRALEVAEVCLDKVTDLFNTQSRNGGPVSFADLIAQAAARTQIAQGWTWLAEVRAESDPHR